MAQPLGRQIASGVARQVKGLGDRWAEQRVAKRVQHEGQSAFGDMMGVVTDRELRNETADRIEDRVQRVAVAGDDHPGGEGTGPLPAKSVEALVDDEPGIGFAGAGKLDGFGDAAVDGVRDRLGELALKSRRRAEMVKEVGVSPADLTGDGLERDGLGPVFDQKLAGRGERGRAAFFRGQAGSSY